jgi:hypothetical protein
METRERKNRELPTKKREIRKKGSAAETFRIPVGIARAGELRRGLSPRAKPELQSSIREDVTLPAICQCVKVWILTD